MTAMGIRAMRPGEGAAVRQVVAALAASHGLLHYLEATAEDYEAAVFRPDAIVGIEVATIDEQIVGCAVWHRSFSTFRGGEIMYLEDLAVLPEFRRRGVARGLLRQVAGIATRKGFSSIYWVMMDWNTEAEALYRSVGAEFLPKMTMCRVHGEALTRLAQ
jgi:GNAT superfamily N-acetyltransferase